MLSPQELEALWKYPQVRQFHASAAWSTFATIATFDTALAKRYGPPKSLEDYVAKSQLENYDNVRAQFEAFNARMDAANPSTGVIYWMLNNAWPSLHWHLYDYFLNPAGAYFGARMANEPVHIQYSYDTRAIMLVNHTLNGEHGLQAMIRVRDLDGGVSFERRLQDIDLASGTTRQLATLPALAGLSRVYFIELELASANGKPISRNVYWLSTQADELDWAHSNWYLTPVTRYADLTALAVVADRDERGPGHDAARGSRGHRDGHTDGTPVLPGRGAVSARVDQAIRGRRADAADPVERQRRHAVARGIAYPDGAFRDARGGDAGRRSERMERSDPERPGRRRGSDSRFAGEESLNSADFHDAGADAIAGPDIRRTPRLGRSIQSTPP